MILNAIGESIALNRGSWSCASGPLPTSTPATMATTGTTPLYDIAPCLVPAYLPNLPFDPSLDGAYYSSTTDYNTGYDIIQNPTTTAITISAPGAEEGETVSVTR